MNVFDALFLGIVEGLTEFLPVSSTGHMILAAHWLGFGDSAFAKSFEIIIQLGAILAVVILYKDKFVKSRAVVAKVITAFLPTAVIGLALYSLVKKYLLGNALVVVTSLFIGGVVLIVFERFVKRSQLNQSANTSGQVSADTFSDTDDPEFVTISYKKAGFLGLWQAVAIIPGVSRSAATIVGGELMGIGRKTIVEFSFLLAVPTMLSATALDIYKHADTFHSSDILILAVGFCTAFVVALVAIKSFLTYIQKHSFVAFGYYRILVAVLYAWLFLL